MIRLYKAFLFLFIFNAFVFLLGLFCLDLRFLIPVVFFLLVFNGFLCAFIDFYLKDSFSVFPKDDFYGISKTFEQMKQSYPASKLELLKTKDQELYWTFFGRSKLALSEDFLDSFNQKERKLFLSYVFQLERSGDLFFISLASAFLFVVQKIAGVLTYPLILKKSSKTYDKFSLWLFSLFMKSFLYQADQKLVEDPDEKSEQALFLWRLSSFTKLNSKSPLPLFLAPLCLINPLKFSEGYPPIKLRIKRLIGSFPA